MKVARYFTISKRAKISWLCFVCLWFCDTVAAQTQLLKIVVRDARSSSLVASELECGVGERQIALERKLAGVFEASRIAAGAGDIVRVKIAPAEAYGAREIAVQNARVPQSLSLVFHVARKRPQYTYPYLDEGLPFQTKGDFDKALAHYELAFLVAPRTRRTQYDVKLKYNYAMALANACLRANYQTCDEAKNLLEEMKRDVADNLYARERITITELDRTLRDLQVNEITKQYAEFTQLFNKGDYVAAGDKGATLLAQYGETGTLLNEASLTKDRLREDVGTAYFRAAEATPEKTGQAELRGKARSQLTLIKKKPGTVTQALRLLEG